MATQGAKAQLDRCLESLSESGDGLDPRQAIELIESAMETLEADPRASQSVPQFADIEELAQYIKTARAEIAELRPQEINEMHLPLATDELDAIVEATEKATNNIFEAVEAIEELTVQMEPATAEAVTNRVTAVYEACSFQDITGQRITKVVAALKQVEDKIDKLLNAFGREKTSETRDKRSAAKPHSADDGPVRPDDHLLNGPQRDGDAISQADVDALLGSK